MVRLLLAESLLLALAGGLLALLFTLLVTLATGLAIGLLTAVRPQHTRWHPCSWAS